MEKVHAFFMFTKYLILVVGEEIWRGFDKGQVKFLFLLRVLYLFGLARPDEMPNKAVLCWIAWLQKVQSVEIEAN